MFSCLFLPSLAIDRLGTRLTMVICIVPYIFYMAANLYATWWTVLPACAILGLGAAPLWTAGCAYLASLGRRYAYITGNTNEDILSRFFGLFFMAYQSGMTDFRIMA